MQIQREVSSLTPTHRQNKCPSSRSIHVKQKLPTERYKIAISSRTSPMLISRKKSTIRRRHVRSTIFYTHDNPSCEQPLIQKVVLAVHSRETRNFSRDSSRFLRDESRFSRYESRFSREGGNLHLSGTVLIDTVQFVWSCVCRVPVLRLKVCVRLPLISQI